MVNSPAEAATRNSLFYNDTFDNLKARKNLQIYRVVVNSPGPSGCRSGNKELSILYFCQGPFHTSSESESARTRFDSSSFIYRAANGRITAG